MTGIALDPFGSHRKILFSDPDNSPNLEKEIPTYLQRQVGTAENLIFLVTEPMQVGTVWVLYLPNTYCTYLPTLTEKCKQGLRLFENAFLNESYRFLQDQNGYEIKFKLKPENRQLQIATGTQVPKNLQVPTYQAKSCFGTRMESVRHTHKKLP